MRLLIERVFYSRASYNSENTVVNFEFHCRCQIEYCSSIANFECILILSKVIRSMKWVGLPKKSTSPLLPLLSYDMKTSLICCMNGNRTIEVLVSQCKIVFSTLFTSQTRDNWIPYLVIFYIITWIKEASFITISHILNFFRGNLHIYTKINWMIFIMKNLIKPI